MTVKIIYSDICLSLKNRIAAYILEKFPEIEVETYNESHYKNKKKAIMIKASCGTKLVPFVAIYNNKELVKAFYSEVGDCTADNIIKYLNGVQ